MTAALGGTFRSQGGTARNGAECSPQVIRVIAIVNQKGGVGKTTTAINLGASLAADGHTIVLIDLDPQANTTSGLGIPRQEVRLSTYDLLLGDVDAVDAVVSTAVMGLYLIPSTIHLAGAEVELAGMPDREHRLKRALRGLQFPMALIDCPPSLGLLTINALVAATEALIPIQCEYYALEGLMHLLRSIDLVRQHLNPELDLAGMLLTMHDPRTNLSAQVEHEVRQHFGDRVYRTVIPRSVRLAEAPSHGKPVALYDPGSRGAVAYRELAREVVERGQRRAALS